MSCLRWQMPAVAPARDGMTWRLCSMARSDDRRESQEHRRSRVCARDDGKERERSIEAEVSHDCLLDWVWQRLNGMGARAWQT